MNTSKKPQRPRRAIFSGESQMLSAANVETEVERVLGLLNSGRIEEGIAKMEQLRRWGAETPAVLYNLGVAYNSIGNFDGAVSEINRLIEISPSHLHAYAALSTAYASQGKLDLALESINKGLLIDPEDPYLLRSAASIEIGLGEFKSAREYLNKAEKKLFGDDGILVLQGNASLGLYEQEKDINHLKRAELYFKEVVDKNPNSPHSEYAKSKLTEIARDCANRKSADGLKMHVVFYIAGYFKKKSSMPPDQLKAHFLDILETSANGLKINDPDRKYKAKITGEMMTGMQILSFCYAYCRDHGLPYSDFGFDFDSEFQTAALMAGLK